MKRLKIFALLFIGALGGIMTMDVVNEMKNIRKG